MTIKYLDSKRISALSEDDVTWDASNTSGFSISGNVITSTTTGWLTNYARSTQSFTVGNGEIAITGTIDKNGYDGRIGFNNGTVSASNFNNFEWYCDTNYAYVFEDNLQKFERTSPATRSQGDIFKITIDNSGVVKYYANGTFQYTSLNTASGTYYIDAHTSVSGSIITGTIVDVKPTNVQDNSILVEKDTGKRYWFDTEGATESTGTYAHAFPVGSYDNDKQGFYVANTSSAVYGKTINSVSFWLKRGTSTSGTAYIRVWSDSGSGNTGTQAHEFGSILLSDLTTSYVKHTFSTGSHTLAVNDTVGVQYSGGSSTTSPVVEGASSDVYDGVNTIRNRFTTGGTFSPVTTHDIKFEVTSPTWTYEYALPTISGLKLHLDASDATTITKDGSNLVSAWNDKSGEGNHISQATASKQPLWVANTQNGLPLIRFDGTDDQLNRSTFVSGAISQGFYMFVVMKPTVGAASNPYNFDGGASARGWCYTNSSDEVRYGSATEQIIDSNLPSTPVMYTFFVNGSSSNVRKNSVSTTSGTLGSTSSNGLWLACRHNDTSFGSPDHAEFLFYDNDIGTTNRDAVEAYLKKKWGL